MSKVEVILRRHPGAPSDFRIGEFDGKVVSVPTQRGLERCLSIIDPPLTLGAVARPSGKTEWTDDRCLEVWWIRPAIVERRPEVGPSFKTVR